jgi:hypothetical protein
MSRSVAAAALAVVGTWLRTKVCRRQGDVDRDRLRSQDMIRQIQQVQIVK